MRKLLLVLVVCACAKPAAESPALAPVVEAEAPTSPKPVAEPTVIGNPGSLRNNSDEDFAHAFASEVEKTYAGNVFKGDKTFKDQLVTLTLRVKEIRPALGRPAIMSEGYGQLSRMTGGVRAILADDLTAEEQDMLAELDPGDVVALRCRGAGKTLATPHFKECVPWTVPTAPPAQAARTMYVCLSTLLKDKEIDDKKKEAEMKEKMIAALSVANERIQRDGMSNPKDCGWRSPTMRTMRLIFACEKSPTAPECSGFGVAANREVDSIEAEAQKRLAKKSR